MRIPIVSHIPGKRIALQAVLADLAEQRPAWSSTGSISPSTVLIRRMR
jgi:hypothetical protein